MHYTPQCTTIHVTYHSLQCHFYATRPAKPGRSAANVGKTVPAPRRAGGYLPGRGERENTSPALRTGRQPPPPAPPREVQQWKGAGRRPSPPARPASRRPAGCRLGMVADHISICCQNLYIYVPTSNKLFSSDIKVSKHICYPQSAWQRTHSSPSCSSPGQRLDEKYAGPHASPGRPR